MILNDCHGQGRCNDGRCECDHIWIENDCSIPKPCLNNCTHHGVCHKAVCYCHSGYHGKDCSAENIFFEHDLHAHIPKKETILDPDTVEGQLGISSMDELLGVDDGSSDCKPKCVKGKCLPTIVNQKRVMSCFCEPYFSGEACDIVISKHDQVLKEV